MNKQFMKKIGRDMRLDACLESIKECTNVAANYIEGIYEVNDIDELVVTLRSVEDYIKDIDEIILEMSSEYETEIEVLKNEQLQ